MAAIRNTTRLISGTVRYCLTESSASSVARNVSRSGARAISSFPARCAAASDASHLEKKMPRRRLGPVYNFLLQEEGESFANKENIPKIALSTPSISISLSLFISTLLFKISVLLSFVNNNIYAYKFTF